MHKVIFYNKCKENIEIANSFLKYPFFIIALIIIDKTCFLRKKNYSLGLLGGKIGNMAL